ncbi:MAG: nitroreductase family protein, partial [Erysipelotrichaceae bacterium]|nr:nitroreductase family protein [Erysipelotrichaceae bacterium]
MNAYETIITRRSTRKFRNREVDEKLTDLIIEAGRHAPSGGNSQSSHFFVITNHELLEKLALMVSEAFRKM